MNAPGRGRWGVALTLSLFLFGSLSLLVPTAPPSAPTGARAVPPNIVFIITDDQSPAMLGRMPYLNSGPEGHWTRFTNAFLSYPLCCPSRSTILTGLYPHHHGVTSLSGGALKDASTIATWLDGVGYTTGLVGKYLNQYPFSGKPSNYIPPGWDRWVAFRDRPDYFDYELNENGTWVRYGSTAAEYSTDVIAAKASQFASTAAEPFFLYFSTWAPHAAHKSAPRHKGLYANLPIERSPNFNEADVSDKPAYIRNRSPIDEAAAIKRERNASETMLAVDDGIRTIVEALKARGVLENTVIVFMTDNGFLFGHHRFDDKKVPYEESIRTPLLIRYPGAVERDEPSLTVNTDIAPTLAEIGGTSIPYAPDGASLVPFLTGTPPATWRTSVLIHYQRSDAGGPWWGVRTNTWKYVEYATGEKELYDLALDPYELENLSGKPEHAATQGALADELVRLRGSGSPPTPPPPSPPPPPANRAPAAAADTYATPKDTPLAVAAPGVLGNDSDPDGNVLSAVLVSAPAAGALSLNGDGSFTFTPPTGFTGAVGFTYRASDANAQSADATVTIDVGSSLPLRVVAQADAYVRSNYPTENTGAQTTVRVYTSGSSQTHSYLRFVVPALDGAVTRATLRLYVDRSSTVGGAVYPVTGGWEEATITWTSRPTLLGPRAGIFGSAPAAQWIETDLTAAVPGPGTYAFVLKDGNGTAAWYSSKEGARPPELLITAGGPPPENRPPAAADDGYSTVQDTPLIVPTAGVLANDTDPDGDALSAALVSGPTSGALALNGDGSFTYTPATGVTGSDSFVYRASDPGGLTDEATVTITVSPAGGVGSSRTLVPVEDAYVRSNSPSENTGSHTTLRVYKSGSTETHSYLRFVVPDLPEPVTSVRLRLFVTRSSSVGGRLYPTSGGWTENTITWVSRTPATGPVLATVGPVTATGRWVEVELTAGVTGPGTYNFLLRDGASAAWYGSSESTTPPELVVTTG